MRSVQSKEAKILTQRTANVHRHQKERAKKAGVELPYNLERLRQLVNDYIGHRCIYCDVLLTAKNFSIDHHVPVSRGGGWDISNITVVDMRCNKIKGELLADEFYQLLGQLQCFSEQSRKDIMACLYVGGCRFFHPKRSAKAA